MHTIEHTNTKNKYYKKKDSNIETSKLKREIECPQCNYKGQSEVMLNDGGNYVCPNCSSHVHKCINGYVVSNVGPAFCKNCKKKNHDWMGDFSYSEVSNLNSENIDSIVCPKCNYDGFVYMMFDDGGNYECPDCKSSLHLCNGEYIVSDKGPAFCKNCKYS
jgi:uncharacterized protein (DUF2225 family)